MTLVPGFVPRRMQAGPILLDLLYRDARLRDRWLYLHPREFGLLWRLAETPRTALSRRTLLADVWRMRHEPQTNTLEVHIFRLRRKLAACGVEHLIITDPAGGYRLEAEVAPVLRDACGREMLDTTAWIGNGGWRESPVG